MKIDKRVVVVSILLSFAVALPLARRLVPEAAAKGSHSHGSGYQCPMHPSVVQEREGSCPICGMKLVAMKPQAPTGSGSIPVAPDKQGTLGIAVGTVVRSASTRTLRVPGRVVPDEARLYRINSGVEGSFRDVAADATTGSRVRKNQLLGSFYAPATINTIQVFLLNTAGRDRAAVEKKKGGLDGENISLLDANLQQRRIQFENLGISKKQRDEMWRTRKVPDTLQVVSPTDGFIPRGTPRPAPRSKRGRRCSPAPTGSTSRGTPRRASSSSAEWSCSASRTSAVSGSSPTCFRRTEVSCGRARRHRSSWTTGRRCPPRSPRCCRSSIPPRAR